MIRNSFLIGAALFAIAIAGALWFQGMSADRAQVDVTVPQASSSLQQSAPAISSASPPRTDKWHSSRGRARLSSDPFQAMFAFAISRLKQETNANSFETRAALLQDVVNRIQPNDYAIAFASLAELSCDHTEAAARDLQLRLLQRWAELDPQAAATAAYQLPDESRSVALNRVAEQWAGQDAMAAIRWAENLADGNNREMALLAIAREMASRDPAKSLQLASQIPIPTDAEDFVAQAASNWAANDPEAAAAWARNMAESELRDQVLGGIATAWADQDPIAAANFILDSNIAGRAQENAVIGIVQRLAMKDFAAANAWASEFPDDLKETVLAEMHRISERRRLIGQ